MRENSLSSQQPGTTARSTELVSRVPHLLPLPPTGLEYPRLFGGERRGRHFRFLLPRRRPGGPEEATLLMASSPPILGVEMTGLSYTEMEGCRNLLSLLDNDEIMALCDTITNRLVQPEDRQDAIRAILVYSQSVEELLRRRKVHREIIFKYLATQGVIIPPATEKHNLIQHAKDYWKKQFQPKLKETPEPVKTEDIRLSEQQVKEEKKAEKVDFRRLGEEFCQWFFELLNSQNPLLGPPQDEWGPQHFWHDVKLRFYYNTSEQNVIDYHGAEIVSLRLLSLVKEEFLFLSPNLDSHGLKCAASPHGLVMVGVAGTVHRGNTCLGIFEQIFGLIRCPFVENTWKIKFINLRIIGESSLAPGTLMKPAITFEPSDLEAFYNVNTLCGPVKYNSM